MASSLWFHVDMDAFYAAVEQRENPEYRGKPLIIGGIPDSRGVVSTASYEARKFGVRSAMPTSQAKRLCPQGIFIFPRMERYVLESQRIMKLFTNFTPEIFQVSIDEAFLNMTGTERIFGSPNEGARKIKKVVLQETGLTISVGIGSSKLIAKIASGYQKPDGLTWIPLGEEESFIDKLSIRDLWGVGQKTQQRLAELNINSVQILKSLDLLKLERIFGPRTGEYLYKVSRGIDPGIYTGVTKSHSISNETTFSRDISDPETIRQVLLELSHSILFRLRDEKKESRVLVLKLRYSNFSTTTVQEALDHAFRSLEETHKIALVLLSRRWNGREPLRLIGLGFSQIVPDQGKFQGELFAEDAGDLRRKKVEHTVITLRKRFSKEIIQKGSLMKKDLPDRSPRPKE